MLDARCPMTDERKGWKTGVRSGKYEMREKNRTIEEH